MKIVLLKSVQGVGRIGEIKEVNSGYARNFLIPKGLADATTKNSLNIIEAQQNKIKKFEKTAKENKAKLARKIDGKSFEIQAKANEKGGLYVKLKVKVIASELQKQNYNIKPDEISLKEAINKIGEYEVILELGGEKVKIKLKVERMV